MDTDVIALTKNLVGIGRVRLQPVNALYLLEAAPLGLLQLPPAQRVSGHDTHAKTKMGDGRHPASDPAETDNTQAFAGKLATGFGVELSGPQPSLGMANSSRDVAHQPENMFGHTDVQHTRRVADQNPVFAG